MKPERAFRTRIHNKLKRIGAKEFVKAQPMMMSPGAVVAGTPDTYYDFDPALAEKHGHIKIDSHRAEGLQWRTDYWVEYKWYDGKTRWPDPLDITKRKAAPALSGAQKLWLDRRDTVGGNCAVIIGSAMGAIILTERTWNNAIPMHVWEKHLLSDSDVAWFIVKMVCYKPGPEVPVHADFATWDVGP